ETQHLAVRFLGRVMLHSTCHDATTGVVDMSPDRSGNSWGLTPMGCPHTYCGLSLPEIFQFYGGYSAVWLRSGGILKTCIWNMARDLDSSMVGGSKVPFLQQKGMLPMSLSFSRSGGRSTMMGFFSQLLLAVKSKSS